MKKGKAKGKLIVFEGGEGSGKTTQIGILAQRLNREGYDVFTTKEPGGTKIGAIIRQALLYSNTEKVEPLTELFLLLAARTQHCRHVIFPALRQGKIILCDRFTGSTLAYQVGGRKLKPLNFIKQMEARSRFGLSPHLTILLDINVGEGLKRKNNDKKEPMNRLDNENRVFHQKVRKYFLYLAKKEKNWVKISGSGDVREINDKIYIASKKIL